MQLFTRVKLAAWFPDTMPHGACIANPWVAVHQARQGVECGQPG